MKDILLSYGTAEAATKLIEKLPSGPQWMEQTIQIEGFATKSPITWYFRDTEACVEYLFKHPLLGQSMQLVPSEDFTANNLRIVTEPMTAQWANDVQVGLIY